MCYNNIMDSSIQKGHENEGTKMDQYFGCFSVGFFERKIGAKNGT